MMTDLEENALKIEVEKLRAENVMIAKLITVAGFFELYFAECKKDISRQDAFDTVNELHLKLLGYYKYSSYEYFKQVQNRYYKNQKK
jgi:hypothetical protein